MFYKFDFPSKLVFIFRQHLTYILYSYIEKNNHSYLLNDILPQYSIGYQNRIIKFKRWEDIQSSILGRLLLFKGLKYFGKHLREEDICYTSYSKPYFVSENIKFNISHSGDIVVCAISDVNDIGIDIEIRHDLRIDLFKFQMTDNEWLKIINSKHCNLSFFKYWSQKEAIIKAHGQGLSLPLKSFEIFNNQSKIQNSIFFLEEIRLDDKYVCYLAFKDKKDFSLQKPKLIIPC